MTSVRKLTSQETQYCHDVVLAAMLEEFNIDSEYFEPDETRYCDRLCKWLAPDEASPAYSDAITSWFSTSTSEEMELLFDTLSPLETLSEQPDSAHAINRERFVISESVNRLVPDEDYRCYAHGMLIHRSAYTSASGLHSGFTFQPAWESYLGLLVLDTENRTTDKLVFSTEQTTAILQYLFESSGGSYYSESSPVKEKLVHTQPVGGRSLNQRAWVFKDTALRDLIAEHHERVDDVVLLAKTRSTQDATLLRHLIQSDNHMALISGHL